MEIKVNESTIEVPENTTCAGLLSEYYPEKGSVAVAVNGKIVLKSQRDTFILRPNDDIIIIKAAYGG